MRDDIFNRRCGHSLVRVSLISPFGLQAFVDTEGSPPLVAWLLILFLQQDRWHLARGSQLAGHPVQCDGPGAEGRAVLRRGRASKLLE